MARIPSHRIAVDRKPHAASEPRKSVLGAGTAVLSGSRSVPLSTPIRSAVAPPPKEVEGSDADDRIRDVVAAALHEQEAVWTERMERAVKDARASGYADGRQAAETEQSDQIDSESRRLHETASRLEAAFGGFLERSESTLAALAFAMAESILESPLPNSVRSISTAALAEAVESLQEDKALRVSLHPVDLMALKESGVADQLSEVHPRLQWHPDASLAPGDWEASSDRAVVRRAARELLADLRDRLQMDHLPGTTS